MDKVPKLHAKVLKQAPNENFGKYVWETALKPQMGYSFDYRAKKNRVYAGNSLEHLIPQRNNLSDWTIRREAERNPQRLPSRLRK